MYSQPKHNITLEIKYILIQIAATLTCDQKLQHADMEVYSCQLFHKQTAGEHKICTFIHYECLVCYFL